MSDIGLMPGLSRELQSAEWLDGVSQPAVGARFLGRSKHDALGEWSTTSHVVQHDPGRVFAWAVQIRSSRARRGGSPCVPSGRERR